MLCAFSTSISETLHIFGQLPTVLSIALFLNAIPHISGWIEKGKLSDLGLAICLTAATTSVHHVTPLFGTGKPAGRLAIAKWASPALVRGVGMGLCMLFLIVTIVFPYWHWSITDPITQVSMWEGRGHTLLKKSYGAFLSRAGLVLLLVCYVSFAISTALLPTFRPTQPDFIDPAPIVKFMDEDRHSEWRYLTLGFGDQFAYHSALINAESVDGNYHSARRLPGLMNYSVERLENSKYAGVPGLASLNQFLVNAETFHLKYVFSNDEFYALYAGGPQKRNSGILAAPYSCRETFTDYNFHSEPIYTLTGTFTDELTSADDAPKFRDLTGQRLLRPVDPVQRLARPKVAIMAAEFVEQEGRFFVTGRVKNLSEFPACTKVFAQTLSGDSSVTLEQHAGRIGSHRLLPGEASAFRIDFEGYLKIQDQAFNAAYNPEQFSVPELARNSGQILIDYDAMIYRPLD